MDYIKKFQFIIFCVICATALAKTDVNSNVIKFDFPSVSRSIIFSSTNPLFRIHTSISGKDEIKETLIPSDFKIINISTANNITVAKFNRPPTKWGGDILVTVTFEQKEKEVEARLSIDNQGYLKVKKIQFPIIKEREYSYDTLLLSHNAGDAISQPGKTIGGRLGGTISLRYPAELAMQYLVLFNQGRSVYLSAYSQGEQIFDHTCATSQGDLNLSLDWFPFLEKGTWTSPLCGFSILPGGWHLAADIYRERMQEQFSPPPLPRWMQKEFNGWLQLSLESDSSTPNCAYDKLADYYKTNVDPLGLNCIQIFSWHENRLFNVYPCCYASEICGGTEVLKKAIKDIKEIGGHASFYINGRLLSPKSSFYKYFGAVDDFAMTETGGQYLETYSGSYYVACPSASVYQSAILGNFDRMLNIYGNDGVFIDQINCSRGQLCYSTKHGHTIPAKAFTAGLEDYLKKSAELCKTKNPDFFIWAEGVSEFTGRYLHVHQGHGETQSWTAGESMPEQFSYTYPNYKIVGIANSIDQMCHTFGQGKAFDFHYPRLFDRNSDKWKPLLKSLVKVRKSEPDYFYNGIFRDTVGLEVVGKDVRYWGILRRDGKGMLANFWARGRDLEQPASVWIKAPLKDCQPRLVYPDTLTINKERACPISKSKNDWYKLEWVGPIATLIWEIKQ